MVGMSIVTGNPVTFTFDVLIEQFETSPHNLAVTAEDYQDLVGGGIDGRWDRPTAESSQDR